MAEALSRAHRAGYGRIRLDTLPFMDPAIHHYRSLGFVEVAPYAESTLPGTRFLERLLVPLETTLERDEEGPASRLD